MTTGSNIEQIMAQFPGEAIEANSSVEQASTPPDTWRDSGPVTALSEYLKTCEGIRLMDLDGCPTLHFIGGIRPTDEKRWSQALKALALLEAARDDLKHLMAAGKLNLPEHTYYLNGSF